MKESVQFACQCINSTEELDRFLASGIPWAGFETRVDPFRREVVLGADIDKHRIDGQRPLAPGHVIAILRRKDKSIRFDLQGSVYLLENLINEIAPLILASPGIALELLNTWAGWGINRFSVGWKTPRMLNVLRTLDCWGFETDIDEVPDLESFVGAILLRPASITLDFNDADLWCRARGNFRYPKNFPEAENKIWEPGSGWT